MAQKEMKLQPTRRRVMQYAGLALAATAYPAQGVAAAADPQEAPRPTYPDQIGNVMQRLSTYMSQARDKDLPIVSGADQMARTGYSCGHSFRY